MKNPVLLLLIALVFAARGHALNIVIFNTGVDSAGQPLAGGAADPHYDVLVAGTPDGVVLSNPAGSYVANNATSKWIWETSSGNPGSVIRTFRTTFDLTGMDPLSAVINGRWSTDNAGNDILINGVSTGQTSPSFTVFTNFSISAANLLPGFNTIDFAVQDFGAPAAFRAEFTTATANALPGGPSVGVPDSGSTWAMLTGTIFLFVVLSRRSISRR